MLSLTLSVACRPGSHHNRRRVRCCARFLVTSAARDSTVVSGHINQVGDALALQKEIVGSSKETKLINNNIW